MPERIGTRFLVFLQAHRWILMLLPALALLTVFFLIPLLNLGRIAFFPRDRLMIYLPRWTTENFRKFFSDPYYWSMVLNSLKVGILTTVFALLFGYPIAYYLTLCKGVERTILLAGFLASLFVTILVTTLGWQIILLPFGVIQRVLSALGLISGAVRLLKLPALILVLTYLHISYAILILAASIQSVPKDKLHAARILGAPTWKIFTKIMLPLTMPGIVSSAILVFTLSMSSYMVPILITGQRVKLLPIAIYSYTTATMNWPFAAAIALILFTLTLLITYLFIVVTNRLGRRGKWEMV